MRKSFGFILSCLTPSKRLRQLIRENFYIESGKTKNRGGKNNKIILVKNGVEKQVKKLPGCDIYFRGDNNIVKIYAPLKRLHLCIKMYGNSEATIMPSCFLDRRLKIRGMNNCNLFIDSNLFTNSECVFDFADGADIHIGKNCIISDYVEIRNGDGHPITDLDGKRINENKSIFIGNHVWIGKQVFILKGAHIMDNTVVGARSLVTKSFDEENVVIAGMPAKIIKRNINWDFK